MRSCIHTRTHTHLALQQFLQYCRTQVNYINHSCTDRRLRLKLFCLSAPSQLLHADPYSTLALSWWGAEVRAGRRKAMKQGKRSERTERIRDKVMGVKKKRKRRRRGRGQQSPPQGHGESVVYETEFSSEQQQLFLFLFFSIRSPVV